MSMFENESEGVVQLMFREVADQLFDEWNDSNCDEGTDYADYKIVEMVGTPYMKKRFNEYYELNVGDEYYFEVEE